MKPNFTKAFIAALILTGCTGLATVSAATEIEGSKGKGAIRFDAENTGKTLYQRLGEMETRAGEPKLNGTYRIASIVDEVVDRLNNNKVIMANAKIMKINQQVMPGHKFEFTLMVLEMAGGPQKYSGRRLDEAHRHLGISEAEWQAMTQEFGNVLGSQGCPARERKDFMNLIESTRPDVITGP